MNRGPTRRAKNEEQRDKAIGGDSRPRIVRMQALNRLAGPESGRRAGDRTRPRGEERRVANGRAIRPVNEVVSRVASVRGSGAGNVVPRTRAAAEAVRLVALRAATRRPGAGVRRIRA